MKKITVAGLGPGDRKYLTIQTIDCMRSAETLILRTERSDAAEYLKENGIAFDTLDALYEEADDFDELTAAIIKTLTERAKTARIVYAVADPRSDESVRLLVEQKKVDVILPCISMAASLPGDTFGALEVPASSLPDQLGDQALMITELDSRMLASEVKLKLLPWFGQSCPVTFYAPEKTGSKRTMTVIPLEELDRQKQFDHTAACLVRPEDIKSKERYTVNDLVRIMRRLRAPNGCPWDKAQTHLSLRPYLIEEAYEVSQAVMDEDWEHVSDELGDVLLQIVFQADIGAQYGTFDLSDISTDICRKMIKRHPHIFAGVTADTSDAVSFNWEKIKQKERGEKSVSETMQDVLQSLPALMRAAKVQHKAEVALRGLPDQKEAFDDAELRLKDLSTAAATGDSGMIASMSGELLFSLIRYVRAVGTEPESALSDATQRFTERFREMEKAIKKDGKALKDLTTDEIAVYWKRSGRCELSK